MEYNPLIDQARVISTNYIKRANSSIYSILVYSSFGEKMVLLGEVLVGDQTKKKLREK